jgi:serine/threonine protein kinase
MSSLTCRSCLHPVAKVDTGTGLCEQCTLQVESKTVSAENPTGSYLNDDQRKQNSAKEVIGEEPVAHTRLPIPPGYVNDQFIDEGGMGQVYRAFEVSTGRTVAIKMLHPRKMTEDLVARFAVEAKALASLRHPNVVFLYEFRERANPPYLVMEYVDGTTAFSELRDNGRFGIRRAVEVIRQAALGIHAANQHNVIHRDIKPSNLLIDRAGIVKLTDFGLAKRLNAQDDLTIHGGIAGGTPGYLAPEQLNLSLGEITAATDVW